MSDLLKIIENNPDLEDFQDLISSLEEKDKNYMNIACENIISCFLERNKNHSQYNQFFIEIDQDQFCEHFIKFVDKKRIKYINIFDSKELISLQNNIYYMICSLICEKYTLPSKDILAILDHCIYQNLDYVSLDKRPSSNEGLDKMRIIERSKFDFPKNFKKFRDQIKNDNFDIFIFDCLQLTSSNKKQLKTILRRMQSPKIAYLLFNCSQSF